MTYWILQDTHISGEGSAEDNKIQESTGKHATKHKWKKKKQNME